MSIQRAPHPTIDRRITAAHHPRVSVLIPVYNALPWLAIAIESTFTQTFTDYELLLVDDGSTDGSGDVCDGLAERDARVRVLRHAGGTNRRCRA